MFEYRVVRFNHSDNPVSMETVLNAHGDAGFAIVGFILVTSTMATEIVYTMAKYTVPTVKKEA